MCNCAPDWEEGIVLAFHRLSRTPRSISESEYQTNPEWEARHRAFHRAIMDATIDDRRIVVDIFRVYGPRRDGRSKP